MFSLYNIIDLFFLSIPLSVFYNSLRIIVHRVANRHKRQTPASLYVFHTFIAVAAFVFALYYYQGLQR